MNNRIATKYQFTFIGLLIVISVFYNLQHIIHYRPYGLHVWRQCDCASLALNYYQNGMHFFKPELHNNLDGKHGYAVEEFPWLYFLAAVLYKLLGFHEFLFRTIVLFCFFTGLYALFRLSYLLTRNHLISFILPLILFSAPDAIFYGSNFLPNMPAVSIELLAIWMFFEYYYSKKYLYLVLSFAFYALCGLTKISCLISFFALFAIFIFENLNFKINKNHEKIFINRPTTFALFILVITINFTWYFWAKHYDEVHHTGVFLIGILPLWQMQPGAIKMTLERIFTGWDEFYFFAPTFFITLILVPLLYFNIKKIEHVEALLLVFMSMGGICYGILFFNTFYDHDYYFVCLYPFFLITILLSLKLLKNYYSKIWNKKLFKIVLTIYMLVGIIDARYMVNKVIYIDNKYQLNPDIYDRGFSDFLGNNKIFGDVIIFPDVSPDNSLYLINRRGNTNFPSEADAPVNIKMYQNGGIKYLIILDWKYLDRPDVKPFLKNKIGTYKSISVYDITNK